MPAILIRNLDDAILARLKARAARHHRSLQGEAKLILESAVGDEKAARSGRTEVRLPAHVVNVPGPATYGRDEIYGDDD